MESKQKMAIAGSGLIAAGIGLSIVGAAMIVPAVFAWTIGLVEKGADGFTPGWRTRRKPWGPLRVHCIDPSPRRKKQASPRSNGVSPASKKGTAICGPLRWGQ